MQNLDYSNKNSTDTANNTICTTLIEAQYPAKVGKSFQLDASGKLVKRTIAAISRGRFKVVSLRDLSELKALLDQAGAQDAMMWGVPKDGSMAGTLVTQKHRDRFSRPVLVRDKHSLVWPDGPTVVMLDYDPADDGEVLDRDALVTTLRQVMPELKDVAMLWRPSSSSFIFNAETGEQLTGLRGQRLYLLLEQGRDYERFVQVLEARLWAHGFGYIKISQSGTLLERCLFDTSVWRANHLDFIAPAHCVSPLEQRHREAVLIEGRLERFNASSLVLDDDLKQQAEIKRQQARLLAEPEAKTVRAAYMAEQTKALRQRNAQLSDEVAGELVEQAIDRGYLPPDWEIMVQRDGQLVPLTVRELLAHPARYNGLLTLDPLEPDYDGGRLVGKLYLQQSTPTLHSFARGERTFRLLDERAVVDVSPGLKAAAVQKMAETLAEGERFFNYNGRLAQLEAGQLMVLDNPMVRQLIGEKFVLLRRDKPTDPSKELAEQLLGNVRHAHFGFKPVLGVVDYPLPVVEHGKVSIHAHPGYVSSLKWVLDFEAERFANIPAVEDEADVKRLFDTLWAPVRKFPFASDLDRLAMLGALFTAVLRPTLETAPLLAFDAPVQGSGKTKLAQVTGILRTGLPVSAMSLAAGLNREEELRKMIGAQLSANHPVLLLDNILGRLNSASLAALATSSHYSSRTLGKSFNRQFEHRLLTILTGNNLMLTDDLPRRTLQVRLDPNTDKPYAIKHDFEPEAVALGSRDAMILAVLGLIQHWMTAGCPTPCWEKRGKLGSFEMWDYLVAQPLAWLVLQYPAVFGLKVFDLVAKFDERVDEDASRDDLRLLIDGLFIAFPRTTFKAGEVARKIKSAEYEDADSFAARIADGFEGLSGQRSPSAAKVGRQLGYVLDRKVEGARIVKAGKRAGSVTFKIEGTPQWAIRKALAAEPGQWVSDEARATFLKCITASENR